MSLETMKTRVEYMGGNNLGRIKQQKLKSFKAALKNDYNSRSIITSLGEQYRCLINNDNTKSDYDKRYISVEFESQLQPGDVFKCTDDNTYWMVYLPDLVEIAYLKAEIIRCRYQLKINDNDYWIYFQGPTETTVRWNQKKGVNWNELNLSGTVYIQKNSETKDYFDRFTKIKIDGHTWQVDVVDTITVPGIIELELSEYFDSLTEDLVEVYKTDSDTIIGRTSVTVNSLNGYQIDSALFDDTKSWEVLDNDNVVIKELRDDGRTCIVKILNDAINGFNLKYGSTNLYVNIEEQTEMINGTSEVYPYGSYKYTANNINGTFSIEGNSAKITRQKDGECGIEITSGRKGSFVLIYTVDEDEYRLPIKILSL